MIAALTLDLFSVPWKHAPVCTKTPWQKQGMKNILQINIFVFSLGINKPFFIIKLWLLRLPLRVFSKLALEPGLC